MINYKVEIKKVADIRVACLWGKGLPFKEMVPKAFRELMQWMMEKGLLGPTRSPLGLTIYYDDPKAVAPEEVRFKVAVPVPSITTLMSEMRDNYRGSART